MPNPTFIYILIIFVLNFVITNDDAVDIQFNECGLSTKKYYGIQFLRIRGQGYTELMKKGNSGQRSSSIRNSLRAIARHFGIGRMVIDEDISALEMQTTKFNKIIVEVHNLMKTSKANKIMLSRVIAPLVPSCKDYKDITGEDPPYSAAHWGNLSKGNKHNNRVNNGKKLSQGDINTIRKFWFDNSRFTPNNQYVVKKKTKTTDTVYADLYYRQYSIRELYLMFCVTHTEINIHRNTFYRHKPKNIIKPKSKQDYCPICKDISRLELLGAFDKGNKENDDIRHAMDFHKNMVLNKYEEYDEQITNLKEGSALIIIDFKANISLGKGPVEDSRIFFSAPQRTLFGAAVFLKKDGIMYKVNFSIISSIMNHDARAVRDMLNKKILNHPIFDHFKVQHYSFWMDNAPNHFRVKENMATFARIHNNAKQVEINFFAEYHGKSECDRHFGYISRMYREHTSYGTAATNDINTTSDFINMYKNAVISAGGMVVPSVGAVYSELIPMEKEKLNVIISEYKSVEFNEEDETRKFNNLSAEEKKQKKNIIVEKKYKKYSLKVPDKDYKLSNFYKFTFGINKNKENIIIASLGQEYAEITYSVEKKFLYHIEEEIDDYKFKLSTKTAKVDITKSLNSSMSKYKYHFTGFPTPTRRTTGVSRIRQQ